MGTTGTGLPSPKVATGANTVTVTAATNEVVFVYDARACDSPTGNLVLTGSVSGAVITSAASGTDHALDVGNGIAFQPGEDVTLAATSSTCILTYGIKTP